MTTPPDPGPAPSPSRRRLLRWGGGLAAFVAVYAAAGFLVAPPLVRNAIVEKGSAFLRRQVSVAEVKVNPFTLAVTVDGLAVTDRGERLAGWDSLYVRLAPWKILAGFLGVADIRLVRPSARLALDASGRLNVQDLLDGGSPGAGAAAAKPPAARPPARSMGVALDRLEILDARIAFADATRTPTFESELGPLTVRLSQFRTTGGTDSPYSFSGATESGETFTWSGTIDTEPLRSAGTIAFARIKLPKYGPYLRDLAPELELRSGQLGLQARYALAFGPDRRVFTISGMSMGLEQLALARRGDEAPSLEVPRLDVAGVEVDVLGRVASVAAVEVKGGRLAALRLADQRLPLLEMVRMAPSPPSPTPWRWSVAAVRLEGVAVDAEDRVPARPARLPFADVKVRLTGLSGQRDSTWQLEGSLRWPEGGTLSLAGPVRPFLLQGELQLEASRLELAPLGPYLEAAAPLRLAAGTFSGKARTTFDVSGEAPRWTLAGDLKLEGLALRHPTRDEELARWQSLEVQGLDAASTGRRAAVRAVRLVEPRLRAVIFEDGTTGLARGGAAPGGSGTEAGQGAAAGPAWRTTVGRIQVTRGRVSLVDRSVKPPALLSLTDVEGQVTRLSSDPSVRSTVELKAKVDGAAPLTVTGTLNPLQREAYADLAIRATAIDLTPTGPYAGRFLGYGIQMGKLDLDLTYKVENRQLAAGNVLTFNQLTLGEKTDSPEATSLPVRLALAILTDPSGVMLIDMPVEGRTDDPDFKVGRVVWRAFLNVLLKVATSPFSALAALAGGGKEDLSLIEFAAGSAALDEAAGKRVELLARSLAQRPALGLELDGATSPADAAELRRQELERLLKRTKAATLRSPPEDLEAVTITAEERPRWLAAALEKAVAAGTVAARKPVAGAPPPTPAELEERLLGAVTVPPEALPALARARVGAARDALLAAGLAPARLFEVEASERARKEPGARAYFAVR